MEKLKFERPFIKKVSTGLPAKFGSKNRMTAINEIDGIPVDRLLADYGSPLFVLSEKTIRKTINEAKSAFSTRYPKVQFAWSYKTNYLDAVCKIFHQEGSWAEVVSEFEYEKAIQNGVAGSQIIFNGPEKSSKALELAILNHSLIHIDHFDELYLLIELSKKLGIKSKVAIRVNMDTGIYPQWDRFGFNYENGEAWEALNRILLSGVLDLAGLHTHIGTYITTPSAYRVATSKLANLMVEIQHKYNHTIKYIDVGGGFASKNTLRGSYLQGYDTAPSFDEYADAITSALINSTIKPNDLPLLILETGRALIDEAGSLLTTVIANKRLPDGRRATIIDAGVNILFTSFWYDHTVSPTSLGTDHTEETIIYGPLCMNIDIIRPAVILPLVKKGDQLVVQRVGAYNMTQWMQFITMRPSVALIDTTQNAHIIRKKETIDTLKQQEHLPNHLN
ncbi:MAG: hypothetical protein AB7D05_08155 [Mangrovibacterium sp.]